MKKWMGVIFCILMITVIAGCAARSRYKVLSFFFDGVPDPDAPVATAKAQAEKAEKEGAAGTLVRRGGFLEHGPYGARLCHACHQRSSNALILPVEKLCLHCHHLDLSKKYVHGPVSAGGCIVCHDPHSSGRKYLLRSDPREFCLHCHEKEAIFRNPAHKDIDVTCTACHDAHSSDKRFMLK
jgi:predicted CXXCH cytochrome family protein